MINKNRTPKNTTKPTTRRRATPRITARDKHQVRTVAGSIASAVENHAPLTLRDVLEWEVNDAARDMERQVEDAGLDLQTLANLLIDRTELAVLGRKYLGEYPYDSDAALAVVERCAADLVPDLVNERSGVVVQLTTAERMKALAVANDTNSP